MSVYTYERDNPDRHELIRFIFIFYATVVLRNDNYPRGDVSELAERGVLATVRRMPRNIV